MGTTLTTHLARIVGTLVLIACLAAPAWAQSYSDASRNLQRVMRDQMNTSAQEKADAIKGLSVATGRDVRDALNTLFNVMRGRERGLFSDAQMRQFQADIDKLEAEREQILARPSFRSTAERDAAQNRVSNEIPAEINKLKDRMQTNSVCQQAAIDTILRMTSDEAKAEIIKNVDDRDDGVAQACLTAVRENRWSEAFDKVVSAYNRARRNAAIRALCVSALRTIAPSQGMDIFRQALSDESNLVRGHAVAALRAIRQRESVDALIDRLGSENDIKLKWDIVNALRDLTGRTEWGEDVNPWRSWWNRNRDGFAFPPPSNPEFAATGGDTGGGGDGRRTATFYGIEIKTKHPVFVIDRSGSMMVSIDNQHDGQRGPLPPGVKSKWELLQEEFVKCIEALPDDATFAIVWYSTDVSAYRDGAIVRATEREKRAAIEEIKRMNAGGLTNIHEALERAFEICQGAKMRGVVMTGVAELKSDTIFFMTDGTPTVGPPIDGIVPQNLAQWPQRAAYTAALLNLITRWNETRNIVIHTICVGQDGDIQFLQELARRNRGTFRHVTR